tara:strand:+ start:131 stop:1144 length:1014 start_codon:yes stop_codon:yes gene_type:complete
VLRLPPLKFQAPKKLVDVVSVLQQDNVRLVAGGTDLWPNMKRRHQYAETIVSLMSVSELGQIVDNGELKIGATVTLSDIIHDENVQSRYPSFVRALASISSPPLRNMGTLGGNLCVDTRCTYYNQTEEWRRSIDYCMKESGKICWVATKSPRCWAHSATDAAPILCSLGARVRLISSQGERIIPLVDFYFDDGIDYLKKGHDEILTEIIIPKESDATHCISSFWKLRRRGSIDFSVLSVAATLWLDNSGLISRAAIFLGAVGSSPVSVSGVELLIGKQPTENLFAEVARSAQRDATPMDNTDFLPSWRGKMAEQYTYAALCEAIGFPVTIKSPRHGM